jgi:hypothetical protein
MRVRIHRGTKEIGGNCIELSSGRNTPLLDMGMPLTAPDPANVKLPQIDDLRGEDHPRCGRFPFAQNGCPAPNHRYQPSHVDHSVSQVSSEISPRRSGTISDGSRRPQTLASAPTTASPAPVVPSLFTSSVSTLFTPGCQVADQMRLLRNRR